MNLHAAVRRTLQRYALLRPGDRVVVGVSGGPDSLCLLHLLHTLAPTLQLSLHVAHLNHGLRGAAADDDAAFVAATAAAWGWPSTVEQADVAALAAASRSSLEEAARNARYAFLARVAATQQARVVAVGHNADDQAETVLMHFLRGSGLDGLRGMQPASPLPALTPAAASLTLIRPLLFTPRTEIEAYCAAHDLAPRQDASNADLTFFRNRLRHELLPLLASYNPQLRTTLGRTAAALAADADLLHGQLTAVWPTLVRDENEGALVFDLAAWRALPLSLQRMTLRAAVQRLRVHLRDLGFEHVEEAVWLLRAGSTGDQATLPAGLRVTLAYDYFTVSAGMPPAPPAPQLPADRLALPVPGSVNMAEWRVETALLDRAALPAGWQSNADPWQAWLDADALGPTPTLRVRRTGERFQPLGLAGEKLLAEFFTDTKTPAAVRARWPLLAASDDHIAWVCGLRMAGHAAIHAATTRVLHVRLRVEQAGNSND